VTGSAARSRSLKILRIIARLNIGGPARHVIGLDQGLQARGHHTLLAHGAVGAGEASLEHLAAERRVRSMRISGLGRRVSPLSDARALLRLLGLAFRESPDVIHTHTAKAGTLGRIAALAFNATRGRSRRCLVVHTFHGHVLQGYFHPALNILVRCAERALALATHRIVTLSPSQRTDIVHRFAIARDSKTVTIPLGLDLEPLLELPSSAPDYRRELSIGPAEVVIGYVGRMVPIKDLGTLFAAFVRACASHPNLRLLLAGDGPERAKIDELVSQSHIGDRVACLGWTEDLPRVYATMDICALSSLNEGTPVALIEAMAAGRAVVATAVGGVPDVVEEGETGLLVPPGDVEAFAAAVLDLAFDVQRRRRMGMAGRQRAAARFSAERLVDDVERMYVSALAEARGD
jgi:glycosyltransferase involved in cell wall biosynthesis